MITAFNSHNPLAEFGPHGLGYERAARLLPSCSRALLQFSRRYNDPVCRWIPGLHVVSESWSLRLMKDECSPELIPLARTRIFTDRHLGITDTGEIEAVKFENWRVTVDV